MLRIPFEWLEFAFECFESHLKGMNLHSNGLSLVRKARICIRMLHVPVKWFEFAFECLSNGWNLSLNASNPWFEFEFESLSNGSNLHSNAF